MSEKVDVRAFRQDLFGLLNGIAAGGARFLFGLDEVGCMWFDDHWWHPESHVADGILTEQEFRIISVFSDAFRVAYPKFSHTDVVNISELQSDAKWLSVVDAARKAQTELRNLKDGRGI